jgi:hypothetical protein
MKTDSTMTRSQPERNAVVASRAGARFGLALLAALGLLTGLGRATAPAQETVTITEFLAGNVGGLQDEDGDTPDWIELQNAGPNAVNLFGWYLTDRTNDLTRWAFPATNLAAKGFLVVFASDKDRTVAGAPLHTNFKLSRDGGYLALVRPDGVTIASQWTYGPQRANYSYGIGQTVSTRTLLSSNATGKVLVPTNSLLGLTWITNTFPDTTWLNATNGVGYETSVPGFAVRNFKANIIVDTLAKAETVIVTPAQQSAVYSENSPVVNYVNTGSSAHYGSDRTIPGFTNNADQEDFVLEATATVTIPTAGNWTFGVNSDDGFKLTVGSFTVSFPDPRGPADTLQTFNFPQAGDYALRLVFYERGGGSEVELFAASGSYAAWGANFRLVGDTANGGLAVRSLPVSGSGGLGYRTLIRTDLQSRMPSNSPSAYVRLPFSVSGAASLTALTLSLKYDDGCVAYLNGVEVARRHAPASPAWNSTATAAHSGLTTEPINLTDRLGLVREGANLLALHGLNTAANDTDFFLQAELAEIKGVTTSNQFFPTPTPGALNGNSSFAGFVADTQFSHDRGFYDTNFWCVITSATPGALIRYTRDGSWPTTNSGTLYTGPILITNTTTLRAMAYKSGLLPTDVDTHTYVFVNDVVRQSPAGQAPAAGWPTGSSGAGQIYDYGMDPDIVNSPVWGATIREDLKSLPSFSIVMSLPDLFDNSTGIYANPGGDERTWERPCSLELLHPDGTPGFQINCGVRIRGGYSRSGNNPKHAFRFFFRQEYGAASLNYPLFGDRGARTFDKIDLRTFQNYCWAFNGDSRMIGLRDQMSRDLQLAMGQPAERGNFCHLYLNGQYWGLFNTDERPEASYGETYFGGRADDYDTIKVDPDLGYSIEATDGNSDAWYQLWTFAASPGFAADADYFRVQGLNVDGTVNPAYPNLLDVDNLIDYMLVIIWGQNLDAPISAFLSNNSPNNYFALRNRTGLYGGFRFFAHDAEHTLLMDQLNTDRTGPYPAGDPAQGSDFSKSNPQYLWQRLSLNAEFRLRVADRIQRHFFNGGPLSTNGARALFMTRSNEIYRAMVCESARWGDAKVTTPFTRDTWLAEMRNIGGAYLNQRPGIVLNQLRNKGLFPTISAPLFSRYGGYVSNGFNLYLTNQNGSGTIYYTLNGTDPRRRGGSLNPAALAYTAGAPLPINFQTTVRARVLSGTTWSALSEATFYVAQDFRQLIVTEIMYNPAPWSPFTGDDLEFLELKNVGPATLDLSGLSFTEGISFAFTNGTRLAPGQFFVLGRVAGALNLRYSGLAVQGVYSGRLDNGGETLTITHLLGGKVLSFGYKDSGRWPIAPDGRGFSLVSRNPNANANPGSPFAWRASATAGGSPGADDPEVSIAPLVVNEALTHSLTEHDWIELFNPTDAEVDLGGWFLTDEAAWPQKYRIPDGTRIAARGFRVFTEADFNPVPGQTNSFALSSLGENVYLLSGDAATNLTGYSHGFSFGAAEAGVSFGRQVNSVGEEFFVAQIGPTPGAANAGPRVGPLVFREIMYHPPDLTGGVDNTAEEYLLLRNVGGTALPLFDLAAPTNTWQLRGGVTFNFPGLTLPAGGALVLVSFDPANAAQLAAFRAKYGQFTDVPAYGPYGGKLNNSDDNLELYRPGPPTTNGVPYLLVEQVHYRDAAPWPPGPDGSGTALQRVQADAFANDPANWVSAVPLTIVVPPQDAIANNGASATFTVVALGTGVLRYQWKFNGADLPGATNVSLLLTNLSLDHAGPYAVEITDDSGTSALSTPAVLTVLVKPVITVQPRSQIARVGQTLALAVEATGTLPFYFRWRTNSAGTNIIVQSSRNISLVMSNVALSHAGTYDLIITNLANAMQGGFARSSNAYITIVLPPTNHIVAPGANVTFTANAGTPNPSGTNRVRYQWRFAGSDLPGATNLSLALSNVQPAQAGAYALTVVNMDGATASFPAWLVVLCPDCDADGDGLPDAWELAHGLNPTDALDGSLDADGDGLSNREEYLAGTDPQDRRSHLRLDILAEPNPGVVLNFRAVSNRSYSVLCRDTLAVGPWQNLTNIEAAPTNRGIILTNLAPASGERYYRLVTPAR